MRTDATIEAGRRLRLLREAKCLTQRELAARSGVSPRTIFALESGDWCRPTSRRAILRGLGLDYSDAEVRRAVFPAHGDDHLDTFDHIYARI